MPQNVTPENLQLKKLLRKQNGKKLKRTKLHKKLKKRNKELTKQL